MDSAEKARIRRDIPIVDYRPQPRAAYVLPTTPRAAYISWNRKQ